MLELNELMSKSNSVSNTKSDSAREARIEYLSTCLDFNPDHKRDLTTSKQQWKTQNLPFFDECLETMRSFVPANIFTSTRDQLVSDGISAALAK